MKVNRGFFKGLQGKLLLFFLCLSLVPLSIVSVISYQKAKSSLQDMGANMLGDMADGLEGKVDTVMSNRYDDIKAWSSLPTVREGLSSKKFDETARLLQSLQKSYDVYRLIMVFDAQGNLVAASDSSFINNAKIDQNQANRDWFKRAMAGEVVVEDVSFSSTVNDNVVSFSAPVKSSGGQISGVITSRLSLAQIEKIVEEMKDGATGNAFIVNGEGLIIAHLNKEKILKENLTKSADPDVVKAATKMMKGEEGSGSLDLDGMRQQVAFVNSKGDGDYKGIGWSYAMAMGEKELFAPVYNLRTIVLGIFFIAALIIGAIAIVIARNIANPMIKGVAFAQAVAAGDLTQTLEVKTEDEVGDLAKALNGMVTALQVMVGKIRNSSEMVASAANQISAGSNQLTKAAHNQASAAEETSSTMVQMAASIQTVAGNADALASNADEVASTVQELGATSEQVAKGAEVMSSSVAETSATIEQMTVSIDRVAQNTDELASSVAETSSTIEQMTVSIDQVAGNSQELQQIVTETAAIVEQMAVSVGHVAKNVEEADVVAKTAAKEGYAGKQAVEEALASMNRVAGVIEKTADSILNLDKRSEEIGSIVKVINEIADQTNLLALNAAIEAARAGDAGRGFAVVAEEVRKLAERSVNATKEIGVVIKQVQVDTSNSVKYGELASKEAKMSMELSNVAGNALESIVSSVEQTSSLMTSISTTANEQAKASTRVLQAVERMSQSSAVVANAAKEQALGGRQIRVAIERMNSLTQEVTGATKEQTQGSRQIRLAVENMNNVTGQVAIATKEQALSARQIAEAITSMNTMTQSVANATAEQKKGGEMVVAAVENISDITRENLSSVEQLSKAAQNLSTQAVDLATLVAEFKVD